MRHALIFLTTLMISTCAFAQEGGNAVFFQSQAAAPVTTVGMSMIARGPGSPVQGAPYSATMTNENIQTLEDGTHITQNTTGNVARDSEGRTRQDATLPAIGNLSAADAPHLVFIQDPVAQRAYTLNLTDKTAQKMPGIPPNLASSDAMGGPGKVLFQAGSAGPAGGPPPMGITMQRTIISGNEQGQVNTEDLGSQTMEGVLVNGVRTTRTIPAGEIGNDKPITIVTEVWTSPDLKTIVYSKRSDPRMGEQTFRLTNIVRSEPDASQFAVPPDFKIVDSPQNVIYRSNQ
jgi:hypothetical protein